MNEIIDAIAVTAELTQTQLSAVAMATMAKGLCEKYSRDEIFRALERCRNELEGRLSQPAIIRFLNEMDGRPGANEAWSMALQAFDENKTVVLNDEIMEAMGSARPSMESGDETGARMAFRDAYERILRDARASGNKPSWYPSLGHDPNLREDVVKAACDRGLLTNKQAQTYLSLPVSDEDQKRGDVIAGLLTGNVYQLPDDLKFRERIGGLLSTLKRKEEAA